MSVNVRSSLGRLLKPGKPQPVGNISSVAQRTPCSRKHSLEWDVELFFMGETLKYHSEKTASYYF